MLADTLEDYLYLLYLDLSHNRIEGARGGSALARIIARNVLPRGGVENLQNVTVAHNRLGTAGFAALLQVLLILHPERV